MYLHAIHEFDSPATGDIRSRIYRDATFPRGSARSR